MRDILNLVRYQNLIFLIILLWVMENWVARPLFDLVGCHGYLPAAVLWLLIMGTVFIAAGGYVINDYFDVKIDRINRPDRLIVTRSIDKEKTMFLFQGLTVIGVVSGLIASWMLKSTQVAIIFVLIPGLLWFYSSSYKRQFLIGNLSIAFAAGVTPILIGLADVAWLEKTNPDLLSETPIGYWLYVWMAGFGLFAALCTLAREIIKDIQDQAGDKELECHTIPIRLGDKWAKGIAIALLVTIAALAVYFAFFLIPFPHSWHSLSTRYTVFGILVPIACEIVLLGTAKISTDYYHAQQLMKFIMFLGVLYSYVVLKQTPLL